ncbi:TetR/AcrR family transcriptional regulator [Streptomyces sp. NRRL S-1448]|uniref:TetR/AcrR family transcriptional regulator n=1 Tax=Streptomyces sp. NRRL S-1448 TaxID=1463883 RepID=UPI0004C1674E|nr:TetR/AcrR family transcriptional regulator [Streptomyces sp. NRRL S-1448]
MERAERGERILEAAGELLLAWGYARVTIEEIARRAKVGKGTVYLHWRTKDALLLAVILKAQARSQQRHVARLRADPLEVLPSRMMRERFQDFLDEPVLRALYTDDSDILGRLNDHAKRECAELIAEADRTLRRHLEVLRAHGLVRTDMAVRHQQYALLAIATGFFTAETLLDERAPDTPQTRAEILARTIRNTLETTPDHPHHAATTAATVAATVAAPKIIPLYEQLADLSAREINRQVRR